MPTPDPQPGPSPPPPPRYRSDGDGKRVAEALKELNLTRSALSTGTEEVLKRLPEGADTEDLRRVMRKLHRYAEGGAETFPIIPEGIVRKLPTEAQKFARRVPRGSAAGLVLDLVANLAAGEGNGEAVEDSVQGAAGGVVGGWLATVIAGPIVGVFGGEAYADFFANYDEYLARARYLERTDPDYLERVDRAERTGYGFRCEQYEAMGFKPQDVEGCEE